MNIPRIGCSLHAGELDELERISVDAAEARTGLSSGPKFPRPSAYRIRPFGARASPLRAIQAI